MGPYVGLKFKLERGDRIKGTIISKNDSQFDCHIFNEVEYFKYQNNEDFNSIQSFEKVSSAIFELDIPYSDIWYITFNEEQRNARNIQVNIKKIDMGDKKKNS